MCLLNNLSDVLFIDAKLLFSSVRLFKSSSVNMKRFTLLGEKQEQGLVGLATSAHVRNSMQYFFPFLPPKWSLGTSQFSLCFWDEQPVPGKHTFDFTYPAEGQFTSKSVAVAAPAPQPPLRAYPGLGLSGLPPFSSTSPLLAFPFLDGSWPHRCFLATRYLDLPALPTQRSPVLGTLGRCSPLHVPLPHTLRNGHRAAIANRLYLGHRTHTHQGSASPRHLRGQPRC